MAKAAVSAKQDLIDCPEDEEESGWTSYFQDFSSNTNSSSRFSVGRGGGPSSLVSDAASSAACKFSHHHNNHPLSSSSSNNYGVPPNLPDMKLRFNKTWSKQISEDDPLEDTATSPLNSPKDGELNPTEIISRTADHPFDDSLGKGFKSENNLELRRNEGHNKDAKNTNGKSKNDFADLNKKGLHLFPLSMLVNYFG